MKYSIRLDELPRGGISGGESGQLRHYTCGKFEAWETLAEVREKMDADPTCPFQKQEFVWYIGREIASDSAPMKFLWKKGKDIGASKISVGGDREISLKIWPGTVPIDFERNEDTEAIALLENTSTPKVSLQVERESDACQFSLDVDPDTLSVDALRKLVCRKIGATSLKEESVLFFDSRMKLGVEMSDERLQNMCRERLTVLMCQKILLTLRIVLRKSLLRSLSFMVKVYDLDTLEDLRRAICARAAEETTTKDLDPDTLRLKIRGTKIDTAYEKWYFRKQGRPLGDCWVRFFELKDGDRINVKAGARVADPPEAN